MKLKLDDNGNAVLQDGKPVYVHDDGQEIPFDAPAAMTKIGELNKESATRRHEVKSLKEQLALFEGIDAEEAKKALNTVKNLDDKKMIDAGEVDKLKQQMGEVFSQEKKTLTEQFQREVDTHKTDAAKKQQTIERLLLKTAFSQSAYFSGEKPKTVLPPDIAVDYFGKFFKVEGNEDSPQLVGYMGGEKIPSRENFGEPAGFDEAIAAIIEKSPFKDRILRATPGGPNSSGNLNFDDNGKVVTISKADAQDVTKYKAARAEAEKRGLPLRIM